MGCQELPTWPKHPSPLGGSTTIDVLASLPGVTTYWVLVTTLQGLPPSSPADSTTPAGVVDCYSAGQGAGGQASLASFSGFHPRMLCGCIFSGLDLGASGKFQLNLNSGPKRTVNQVCSMPAYTLHGGVKVQAAVVMHTHRACGPGGRVKNKMFMLSTGKTFKRSKLVSWGPELLGEGGGLLGQVTHTLAR